MSTKEMILHSMPEQFSRQQWMDEFSKTGMSYSYACKLLEDAVFSGEIERTSKRGEYEKTKPELEFEANA